MYKVTGETKQRIQYLVLKGVFVPADSGELIGAARRYSFSNLLEIMLAQALSPILNNVDIVKSILDQIRKEYPSFFQSVVNTSDSTKSVLTVMIQSDNAVISYLHDLDELKQCLDRNLTKGVKFFIMYLKDLKAELIKKIATL